MRVYIDTSVIGGCHDPEFSEHSLLLMEEFRQGVKMPVISEIVLNEIEGAPPKVQKELENLPSPEILFLNEEVETLARAYLEAKILTENYFEDALHIALATVYRVDVLVSWNFKHIVNLGRIRKFNGINLLYGYDPIEIRSPREVL